MSDLSNIFGFVVCEFLANFALGWDFPRAFILL